MFSADESERTRPTADIYTPEREDGSS
jgi:hypothetical protein